MIRILYIVLSIQLAYGSPGGPPASSCISMLPEHGATSQQCRTNYILEADKSEVNPNDVIRITVRGATGEDDFKGFLLTAKSASNQHVIGTWSPTNSSMRAFPCNGIPDGAIGHSSPESKTRLVALWHAPATLSEDTILIGLTIVKSYQEIYVGCFNLSLTGKQASGVSNPTPSPNDIAKKANTNVTWTYEDNTVTVNMASVGVDMNEWRAIGFSLDEEMGDEYIFICQVSSTGEVLLRRMHTKLGKRPPSTSNEDVNVIRTVYENGHALCEFSFETSSEQADGEPAPLITGKNYHLLFAAGRLRTEEQVAKHNYTHVTGKTYQLQNPEAIDFDASETTTIPSGASSASTSSVVTMSTTASTQSTVGVDVKWTYANGVTDVKMRVQNLKASQWLAVALSTDTSMGQDHVFSCEHRADSSISLRRLLNPGGYVRPITVNSVVHFNVTRERMENGIINCDFTLSNFAEVRRQRRQSNVPELSTSAAYHPLIATGNLDGSNNIMRHASSGRHVLDQTVQLNRRESFDYNGQSDADLTNLMKAHGLIMIFVWIVLVSTGILVARYFKRAWSDRKICGKAVWFAIHRTVMSAAALLTLTAFVLILVYKRGQWTSNTSSREFAHSIVGILVISFAVIQPFMAIFRCNPGDRYRFIFNYTHALVGSSAFILSIVAIFLAMFFERFEFQVKKEWAILVAWCCWLPIIFIIFEVIDIYFRQHVVPHDETVSYDLNTFSSKMETKSESSGIKKKTREDRMKIIFLLFHLLVAVALSLALMILIGQS